MSTLLIELETKGHHVSSYLRSIVAALKKKEKKIIFLTSKEIKNDYYNFFKNIQNLSLLIKLVILKVRIIFHS